MASDDAHAVSLPFVDDVVAAPEEAKAVIDEFSKSATVVNDFDGCGDEVWMCGVDTCTWAAYPTVWGCPTASSNQQMSACLSFSVRHHQYGRAYMCLGSGWRLNIHFPHGGVALPLNTPMAGGP